MRRVISVVAFNAERAKRVWAVGNGTNLRLLLVGNTEMGR